MDSLKKTYSLYVKNVSYLPAFYLLPAEFVTGGCDYRESRDAHARPYRELPRNPYEAVLDEKWRKMLKRDTFPIYVLDGLSYLMWSAFEDKDKLNTFSSDDPLWKLVFHAAAESIDLLREYGYTTEAMLGVPRGYYIQYMPYSQAERLMCDIAERLIAKNGWQELIEYIKSNRCFEDFNGTKSKDYLSFFRDWYRTRFCEWVNFSESAAHDLQKDSFHTDAYVKCEFTLDYERFLSVQDDDTRNLIRLLGERESLGGLKGVAAELDISTHSAVSKRAAMLNAELSDWFMLPPPGERYAQRKRDEALRKERFALRKAELSEAREKAALRQMLGADYFDDSESLACEEVQAPCRPNIVGSHLRR